MTEHEEQILAVFNDLASALRHLDETADAHAKAVERVNACDARLRFLARGGNLSLAANARKP